MMPRRRVFTSTPARPGRRRDERGSAAIEAVIVLPVFLLLVFLIVQGALWYSARSAAQATATTAMNAARTYQSTAEDGVAAGDDFLASHTIIHDGAVTVNVTPTTVTVTVTGRSAALVPGFAPEVSSTVTGPVERWVN